MAGKTGKSKNKAKEYANRRVYKPDDIREILSIGKNAVYDLIKSNQFQCVKIGDQYRISKKSFDKWLDGIESLDEGADTYDEE